MKDNKPILFGLGVGAGAAVVLILVFFAGIHIGSKRNDIPPPFPFWEKRIHISNGFVPDKFGHGVVGTIDSIGENTFIAKDRMGGLKTILVDDKTLLRHDGSIIKFADLEKDDKVIILGDPEPEEGAITARVVRVLTEFERR